MAKGKTTKKDEIRSLTNSTPVELPRLLWWREDGLTDGVQDADGNVEMAVTADMNHFQGRLVRSFERRDAMRGNKPATVYVVEGEGELSGMEFALPSHGYLVRILDYLWQKYGSDGPSLEFLNHGKVIKSKRGNNAYKWEVGIVNG